MKRWISMIWGFFFMALFLCHPVPSTAMDILYDDRLGDGYGAVLHREVGLYPYRIRGDRDFLFEVMADPLVEAIEVYEFQAETLLQNGLVPLYWYPHYTVSMVLAVDDHVPLPVNDWRDLVSLPVTVGIPVDPVNRDLAVMALSYGLSGELRQSAGIRALKQIHREGRLCMDSSHGYSHFLQSQSHEPAHVYIVSDVEVRRWIGEGRPVHVVYPASSTLSFRKGLLSKRPLFLEEKRIGERLRQMGYDTAPPENILTGEEREHFMEEMDRISMKYQVLYPYTLKSLVPSYVLYIFMIFVAVNWGNDMRRRMKGRRAETYGALMILTAVLWLLTRTMAHIMPNEYVTLRRYNWYSYYAYIAVLMVLILFLSFDGDKEKGTGTSPLFLKVAALLDLSLALLVMTNDWHHLVFSFPEGLRGAADIHDYEWGYYALAAIYAGELALVSGWLIRKALRQHIGGIKLFFPVVILSLYLVYVVCYALGMGVALSSDFTFTTVAAFFLWMELMIDSHMIEGNRGYTDFFSYSPLAMEIRDRSGHPVYRCAGWQGSAPGRELKTIPVQGGRALWWRDVRELKEKKRELSLVNQALVRSHEISEKEADIRRSYMRLSEEWKVFRELETIVKRKGQEILRYARFLKTAIPGNRADEAVFRLNILASYVKKRCILYLKGKETDFLDIRELTLAVDELFRCLSLRGIHCVLNMDLEEEVLPLPFALTLYDFLEELVEAAIEAGEIHLSCHLEKTEEGLLFSVMAEGSPWLSHFMDKAEKDLRFMKDYVRMDLKDLGYASSVELRLGENGK